MKIPVGVWIAVATLAVIAALAGGAWWWWKANVDGLMESAHAFALEGQKLGATLTESGCVAATVERHGKSENRTFGRSIQTSLFLRACLDESKAEATFCDGVPSKEDILPYSLWTAQTCTSLGFTDYYCPHVVGMIPEYCSSAKRTLKRGDRK
jgi:hypothetical protein